MEREQVIKVLESLANGIDPNTGGQIPYETFQTTETVRALFTATTLLKAVDAEPNKRRRNPAALTSAGTSWSAEEDGRLCREFDAGMTTAQIVLQHGRHQERSRAGS